MKDKQEQPVNIFPPGWDEDRVRRVLEHYESQTEDEMLEEFEADIEPENPPA